MLIFSLLSGSGLSAAPPAVSVHFTPRTVVASGFSPGAQVLFFGVGKIPLTYYSRFRTWQFVATAEGGEGTATMQSEIDIPMTSVWAIADLRTGQVRLATPRTVRVRTVAIGRSAIRGASDTFSFDRSYLDLLYVRPGEGAWIWHASDGSPGDRDGANGLTTINIASGVRVTGASIPKVFAPGGTLVAIDSFDLTVLSVDARELLPGGPR